MKRDEVLEGLAQAVEYTRSHARTLITGAVVLLVAALIAVALYAYRERRAVAAQEALADIITEMSESGGVALDPEILMTAREKLQDLAAEYSGTSAGRISTALAASMAASGGDLETARQELNSVSRNEDDVLSAQTLLNLFRVQRAMGQDREVVSGIDGMMADEGTFLPVDTLLFERGVSYLNLDEVEAARADFQKILDEHPQSVMVGEARRYLDRLPES